MGGKTRRDKSKELAREPDADEDAARRAERLRRIAKQKGAAQGLPE